MNGRAKRSSLDDAVEPQRFPSSQEAVRNLLRVIGDIAGSERCFLARPGNASGTWFADVSHAPRRERVTGAAPVPLMSVPPAAIRRATSTKRPVYYQSAASPATRTASRERRRSSLCVPVVSRELVIAVLCLERQPSAAALTAPQRRMLGLLVEQTALTIDIADRRRHPAPVTQGRVNSPFLHNTFSVIAEMVVADPPKAEAAIVMLSRFCRYVLDSSSDQIVTLDQELAITRDYLSLEQHRLGDRMQVEVVGRGPLVQVYVPALILQGLAEALTRLGVARRLGAARLHVEVSVTPRRCHLCVRGDSLGVGVQEIEADPSCDEVKRRLLRFYPGTHSFRIDTNRGVSLEVTIPRDEFPHEEGGPPSGGPSPSILILQQATQHNTDQQWGRIMSLPKKTGLLAFIYDVYTDPAKAKEFKGNAEGFMDGYGLTQVQKVAVWQTGLDPKNPENATFWSQYGKKTLRKGVKKAEPEDRDKADPVTMAGLCSLLVKELCQAQPFDDAW
jgi:hypothetical protein